MKKIVNPNILFSDVDGTIIEPFDITKHSPDDIIYIAESAFVELKHITDRIKRQHNQQHMVVIWSQGGDDWAETVIKALKLEDYVDMIMTKPKWIFDDLPMEAWSFRTIP